MVRKKRKGLGSKMFDIMHILFLINTEFIMPFTFTGLRDNFRIEWKKIPRDENDQLLIEAENFTGSKWQYYTKLTFLADHMRTRTQLALGSNDNIKFETVPDADDQLTYTFESAATKILEQENNQDVENESSEDPELIPIPEFSICTFTPRMQMQKSSLAKHNFTSPSSSSSYPKSQKLSLKRKHEDFEVSNTDKSLIFDDNYHFLMSLHPYMSLAAGSQKLKLRIKIQKLLFKELFKDFDEEDK